MGGSTSYLCTLWWFVHTEHKSWSLTPNVNIFEFFTIFNHFIFVLLGKISGRKPGAGLCMSSRSINTRYYAEFIHYCSNSTSKQKKCVRSRPHKEVYNMFSNRNDTGSKKVSETFTTDVNDHDLCFMCTNNKEVHKSEVDPHSCSWNILSLLWRVTGVLPKILNCTNGKHSITLNILVVT